MNTVITISREFGSGGHCIGEQLAKKLSIPFYDKEIIMHISEETGFSADYVQEKSEYAPNKSIFAYGLIARDNAGVSSTDKIIQVQTDIIKRLAQKGDCIIIGRCADYILKENSNCINIFIHGNKPAKCSRIEKLYKISEKDSLKLMNDMDKKRRLNYQYCTDQSWGNIKNYTITLNSSEIGIETCVDIISALYKLKKQ